VPLAISFVVDENDDDDDVVIITIAIHEHAHKGCRTGR
jgi:hypothetical protein